MTTQDRRLNSPQSVLRVIQILETLATSSAPLGLADLSRELHTPKSSLAALLRGLLDADFIVAADGGYRLGPGAFGLGSALIEARRRLQSSDLIRDVMRSLAERSGETALFAVLDEEASMLTYVDVIESRNPVRFAVSIGDRRPLYCTAAGRMLLATLADEDIRSYLSRIKPEKLTPGTETRKKELMEAIEEARRSGIAQTVDEAADGVAGFAAPVRGASGRLEGVLLLAAPTSRALLREAELAEMVKTSATNVARSLGFRGSATIAGS